SNSQDRADICRLTRLAGKREILAEARELVTNEKSLAALEDLDRVFQIAEEIGIARNIDLDLGEVGELDYYTGLTFNIYAPGLGSALGRGGRYDQLLAKFGCPEPAVGFSLCLDWLVHLLAPVKSELAREPDEVVRLQTDGDVVSAFKKATRLRAEGNKIEIE
ncbi:MAG TPA: ATP phosphoribosyltransferase regulatory subunit, partial [Blastocatellia bacterium]|nr:ATP phosphoribosyltransferase regulatory subunit [Blastocatellia bacterium]